MDRIVSNDIEKMNNSIEDRLTSIFGMPLVMCSFNNKNLLTWGHSERGIWFEKEDQDEWVFITRVHGKYTRTSQNRDGISTLLCTIGDDLERRNLGNGAIQKDPLPPPSPQSFKSYSGVQERVGFMYSPVACGGIPREQSIPPMGIDRGLKTTEIQSPIICCLNCIRNFKRDESVKCMKCERIYYCSNTCLEEDRVKHKNLCKRFDK